MIYYRRIREVFKYPKVYFEAAYWNLLGKKIRSNNLLIKTLGAVRVTDKNNRLGPVICRNHATVSESEAVLIRSAMTSWQKTPFISVVLPVNNPVADQLRNAIKSVEAQIYRNWELCIAADCSINSEVRAILDEAVARNHRIRTVFLSQATLDHKTANAALQLASGPFIALLAQSDLLPIHALYHVAAELVQNPDVDLIYSDEDEVGNDGSLDNPHFKPGWNEELFLAQGYLNHFGVFRTSLLRKIGGFRGGFAGSEVFDLVLRFVDQIDQDRISHIPRILYHKRMENIGGPVADKFLQQVVDARQRAVRTYLASRYPKLSAEVISGPYSSNRIIRRLPEPTPHVSVIIPTRDRVHYLRKCISSLFEKTAYPNFDVVVVDNGSVETETRTYLDEVSETQPITVLRYEGEFNYSAINNFAAQQSKGAVLALLNNDIEVISSDWLREMVSYAVQPHIGAVGARLLYANGTIQHAGIILGVGGTASHAFLGYPGDDQGYRCRLQLPQFVSAVTGACLVIEKAKYFEVAGLDETQFKVAYNDVDFCLKLAAKGLSNVYTPYATLYHHESVSRGADVSSKKEARLRCETRNLQSRWGAKIRNDRYYSVNFSDENGCFQYSNIENSSPIGKNFWKTR